MNIVKKIKNLKSSGRSFSIIAERCAKSETAPY